MNYFLIIYYRYCTSLFGVMVMIELKGRYFAICMKTRGLKVIDPETLCKITQNGFGEAIFR